MKLTRSNGVVEILHGPARDGVPDQPLESIEFSHEDIKMFGGSTPLLWYLTQLCGELVPEEKETPYPNVAQGIVNGKRALIKCTERQFALLENLELPEFQYDSNGSIVYLFWKSDPPRKCPLSSLEWNRLWVTDSWALYSVPSEHLRPKDAPLAQESTTPQPPETTKSQKEFTRWSKRYLQVREILPETQLVRCMAAAWEESRKKQALLPPHRWDEMNPRDFQ